MSFQLSFERKDIIYLISIIGFIIFAITKIEVIATLSALIFIFGVIDESWDNIKENGWQSEAKEIGISILIALGIWFGATYLLGTSSPFNAVVSCSMLPNLQRGDVILLSGSNVEIPSINATFEKGDFFYESHYVCGWCEDFDGQKRPCQIDPYTNTEANGEWINYKCGLCEQKFDNGTVKEIPCAYGISIRDKYFDATQQEGPIVVYQPMSSDILSRIGSIIHRGIVKVNFDDGTSYYMIKGDNNPMFDPQMGLMANSGYLTNQPPEQRQIIGKMLVKIPVAGYIKLVASGQLVTPENCHFRIEYKNQ